MTRKADDDLNDLNDDDVNGDDNGTNDNSSGASDDASSGEAEKEYTPVKKLSEMDDSEVIALSPDDYVAQLEAEEAREAAKQDLEDANGDATGDSDDRTKSTQDTSDTSDETNAEADDTSNTGSDDASDDDATDDKTTSQKAKEGGDDSQKEALGKGDDEASDEVDSETWESLKDFALSKDIKVENLDNAKKLLMLGSKYHSDISGMDTQLKLAKVLEINKLDDPAKLNLLVDAVKGDKKALIKLLKDNNIDPMTLDMDQEDLYQDKNSLGVNDSQLKLDRAFDKITADGNVDKFQAFYDQMDDASQTELARSPESIDIINEHINVGVYADIVGSIHKEKMLGNYVNTPYLEAYKQEGGKILLALQAKEQNQDATNNNTVKKVTKGVKKMTTKKKVKPNNEDGNADHGFGFGMELSDEEFMKQMNAVLA